MKKRILALLLALTMVAGLVPVMSLAEAMDEEPLTQIVTEPETVPEETAAQQPQEPEPELSGEPTEAPAEAPTDAPAELPAELPAETPMAEPAQSPIREQGTALRLEWTELELQVGEFVQLGIGNPDVLWFSSDEAVAEVDDEGTVTALSQGSADITAVLGEERAQCHITVLPALAVQNAAAMAVLRSSPLDEPPASVRIIFSLSDDAAYCAGADGSILAKKAVSIPYFDLELYGLQDYYFSSPEYTEEGLDPGTQEGAYNHVTLLHALIYMLEVYYCGVDPADAGQGYLYDNNFPNDSLEISGSQGSMYMQKFWGHDENLMYYLNYRYPLAGEGWGATADQIELRNGDEINLAMYTDWGFYSDPDAGFSFIEAAGSVTQGDMLSLQAMRSFGNIMVGGESEFFQVGTSPCIYRILRSDLENGSGDGDVTAWTYVGRADESGKLTVDTSDWEPGEYVVAFPGQPGAEGTTVSTPGSAVVTVKKNAAQPTAPSGDISGDNVLSAADAALLYRYTNGGTELTAQQLQQADMNQDGKLTAVDAAILYRRVNNTLS